MSLNTALTSFFILFFMKHLLILLQEFEPQFLVDRRAMVITNNRINSTSLVTMHLSMFKSKSSHYDT